jgi:hypothetical protein
VYTGTCEYKVFILHRITIFMRIAKMRNKCGNDYVNYVKVFQFFVAFK